MAVTDVWKKIYGIINGSLRIGDLGPTIAKNQLQNNQLDIRAQDGSSDAILDVATTRSKTVVVGASDGKKTSITMAPGAASDLDFILPNSDGNSGDVLKTDGSGNLSWVAPGGGESLSTRRFSLLYSSGSTVDLTNLADNSFVREIIVIVTTAFDGSGPQPSMTIGVPGNPSKFVSSGDVKLTSQGTYIVDVAQFQDVAAQMVLYYTAAGSGATAGAAVIVPVVSVPII